MSKAHARTCIFAEELMRIEGSQRRVPRTSGEYSRLERSQILVGPGARELLAIGSG
jgi:hypothetical protein